MYRCRIIFTIRGLVLAICLIVCFVGCKDKLVLGHYEGNLWHVRDQRRIQEPVKIEVSPLKGEAFLINVKTTSGISAISASFYLLKTKQLRITADFLNHEIIADPIDPTEFKDPQFDREAQCFRSRLEHQRAVSLEFCYKKDRFFLQVFDQTQTSILELSANSFTVESEFTLEEPISLKLSEAIKLVFQRNFSSRIAYQQALQARFAAVAAYLNLVPHLTTNLIWNAAPNYITYIATLQGLVPFLLPSYWFEAKEASIDQEIKDLSLVIMRANLATTVEELTYSLKRDESLIDSLQGFLQEVRVFESFLDRVELSDESWALLVELANFISAALTSDLGDIAKLVRQDRFSLAQSLGFHNINVIEKMQIDEEIVTIDLAVPVDPHAMGQLASERAFELKQIDGLRKIAKLKKIQNYFVWLDPSGDPKQSFGLNTFPQQKLLKSQILELEIERDETKTRIYQNAYKLALDYNEAIQSYDNVIKDLYSIRFDFDKILEKARSGHPIHVEHLKWKAQRYSASLVARQMILANFRIARAKKDRFLLAGYYSQILPRLQDPLEFRFPIGFSTGN